MTGTHGHHGPGVHKRRGGEIWRMDATGFGPLPMIGTRRKIFMPSHRKGNRLAPTAAIDDRRIMEGAPPVMTSNFMLRPTGRSAHQF